MATRAAAVAKSATSADSTATLRATARRVADTAAAMAAAVGKLATPAEVMGTWPEIAHRAKSATTVSSLPFVSGVEQNSYQTGSRR